MAYTSEKLVELLLAAVMILTIIRGPDTRGCFLVLAVGPNQCGHIGKNNETRVTPGSDVQSKSFYLDLANQAVCSGNITSWRLCYYTPESGSQGRGSRGSGGQGTGGQGTGGRKRRAMPRRSFGRSRSRRSKSKSPVQYRARYAVYRRRVESDAADEYIQVSPMFETMMSKLLNLKRSICVHDLYAIIKAYRERLSSYRLAYYY